ncbi:SMI1/KNR4 family protein [Bacillus aquiflavi]|uniref:SMI1/KNR4 family protein n=1 Tax=Bacillus aquiflavi TaxID=2672567 RepID=A0A6B3W032_9BACI|nr:SMI1/KNR4 family protein [Bacillus aquiflavi]MBA4536577.1 SMI1/KNR4 family protein [Bacillus aquiflavi]NEY80944.1 SMI1/KNR4 family protein [Bacillus aquiflavi]
MITSVIKKLQEQLKIHFQPFLNPPASEDKIKAVEKEMNVTFPEDLRALYLTHNGEKQSGPGLFFGLPFLSLDEMLTEWKCWVGLEEDEELNTIDAYSVPQLWIKEKYANRYWIPISTDFGGNHLGIDLDPDECGKRGQVINFGADEEVKYVIAYHLSDFLTFITNTLKDGTYTIDEQEGDVSWSYGSIEQLHFLDAIRTMELPVLHPIEKNSADADGWFEQLDNDWVSIVNEMAVNPQSFTQKKNLLLMGKELTHITPLTICTDVRELVLSGNYINNLSPLKAITSLKNLYLCNNPVTDLKPIAYLKHLQFLNLEKTNVTNIQPLTALSALKILNIAHTKIADYSPLSECKKLETLTCAISHIKQLEAIVNIAALKELHIQRLENVTEEVLALLGNLKTLKSLKIENATLQHVDFLRKNNALQQLTFTNSVIKDASTIVKLSRLTKLTLEGSTIGNLESIASSKSLTTFTGSFAQFYLLKDLFIQKIDFSQLVGETSEEEKEIWLHYLRKY